MVQRVKESFRASEFDVALRDLGYEDVDDIPPSYTAAKAVLVFGHTEIDAGHMFRITPQAVSHAVRRVIKALKEMPGKHRLCPACGRPTESRDVGYVSDG